MKVVIVDDHEVVRHGIRALLATRKIETCFEASTGAEALQFIAIQPPDVVIMDIGLPDASGIEVTRTIRNNHPDTEVVILTSHESGVIVSEALTAGARAVVYKSDTMTDLLQAIDQVSRKTAFLSQHVTQMIIATGIRAPGGNQVLTSREREVLKLLAEGKSYKEIAFRLKISPKTVNVHRANLMEKIQVCSLAELIHYAIRNEIVRF